MIRVTVLKDGTHTRSIQCAGHAMFRNNGTDVVCSAVSILVLTTINSIEVLSDSKFNTDDVVQNEKEGVLIANFQNDLSEKGELLIESMILGLTQIQETYNDKRYLEFQIQEVTSC